MISARNRILLLGDTLNVGGTEGQFVTTACGLDRQRWDVRVACLRAEGALRARLEAAGLTPWSCGPASLKSLSYPAAVLGLARRLRALDVRVIHCFDFYSNVVGLPAARLARVPAVVASQRDLGSLRAPLQQRLHRAFLRLAHHLVVNSPSVAERVARYGGIAGERVTVIPNGVDLARFAPDTARTAVPGRTLVGTLANLRPEKGLLDLAQAAALVRERCPGTHFIVWGDGPLHGDLEREIRALGLAGAVELRGATSEPEAALRALDVFVLPSRSEACSNVLLEAMATGLTVIATRVGGNPALIEDEVSGLLAPAGDPAGLAKVIIRAVEDRVLAAALAARARATAEARFGVDAMLQRLQQFYDRALAEAR